MNRREISQQNQTNILTTTGYFASRTAVWRRACGAARHRSLANQVRFVCLFVLCFCWLFVYLDNKPPIRKASEEDELDHEHVDGDADNDDAYDYAHHDDDDVSPANVLRINETRVSFTIYFDVVCFVFVVVVIKSSTSEIANAQLMTLCQRHPARALTVKKNERERERNNTQTLFLVAIVGINLYIKNNNKRSCWKRRWRSTTARDASTSRRRSRCDWYTIVIRCSSSLLRCCCCLLVQTNDPDATFEFHALVFVRAVFDVRRPICRWRSSVSRGSTTCRRIRRHDSSSNIYSSSSSFPQFHLCKSRDIVIKSPNLRNAARGGAVRERCARHRIPARRSVRTSHRRCCSFFHNIRTRLLSQFYSLLRARFICVVSSLCSPLTRLDCLPLSYTTSRMYARTHDALPYASLVTYHID